MLLLKQENPLWGCKKIANELKKVNIDIHYTTVNKVIQTLRKQGQSQANGSWKRFFENTLGLVICHGFHDHRYVIRQKIISPSDP
jgi:hypothetical protein